MNKKQEDISFEKIFNILLLKEYQKFTNHEYLDHYKNTMYRKLIRCFNHIDSILRTKLQEKDVETFCEYLEEEIDNKTELNSQLRINQCLTLELDKVYTHDEMDIIFHQISDITLQCYRDINTDTVSELRKIRRIPEYDFGADGQEIDYNHPAVYFEQELSGLTQLAQECVERGIDDPDDLISEMEDMMDRDPDMAL